MMLKIDIVNGKTVVNKYITDKKKVVKEFNKFSKQLSKVHKQLATASNSLDDLRNTRTNVMIRKLKNIDDIDSISAQKILEIPSLETNKDY